MDGHGIEPQSNERIELTSGFVSPEAPQAIHGMGKIAAAEAEELLPNIPLLLEVLSLAHRVGKESYWIQRLAKRLEASLANSEQSGDLDMLSRLADRVFQSCRDFSDLAARPELGTGARVRLSEVVVSAVNVVRHGSRSKQISIELGDGSSDVSVCVNFKDVLVNLLENARDASESQQTVTLESRCEDHRLIVRVTDRGHGMSPEILRSCTAFGFTTKAEAGGRGMGLTLARAAVNAAGGRIEVLSEPGVGTTVEISLPI